MTEYSWHKISSFPQEAFEIKNGDFVLGQIEQQFDGHFICKFKTINQFTNDNSIYNDKKELVCDLLDISFNEYIIKTTSNKYIFNKLGLDIFDKDSKKIIEFTKDRFFLPKSGKIKIYNDCDKELLITCLIYLGHLVKKNQVT